MHSGEKRLFLLIRKHLIKRFMFRILNITGEFPSQNVIRSSNLTLDILGVSKILLNGSMEIPIPNMLTVAYCH